MLEFMSGLNGILWGPPMLILLCGTGIYFTFMLKFVQVRKFGKGMKSVFGNFKLKGEAAGDSGMSSFQSLATAIAAQVGTGNVAGAATAIAAGGPGAIFWMWISAFFGMGTIYAEASLAQKYKTTVDGAVTGGPVYYIRAAFKDNAFGKFLAGLFSILLIFALGFMGNAVQSNSIADAFVTAFAEFDITVNATVIGVIIAAAALVIFVGGVKRIASVVEKLVPIMAALYVIISLIAIFSRIGNLGNAFGMIFKGAFNPQAVLGGVLGVTIKEAIRYGVARGLFSNEAGMGSTPHAHAIARVKHPCDQGLVAFIGVFIDTFIVLNMTAFVILTSGVFKDGSLTGIALAQAAFSAVFGKFGTVIIAVCLLFFAFSTIIGWYFFAESNVRYLFGKKFVKVFSVLVCVCIVAGAAQKVELVWEMADAFNGLMVIPNLVGLLAMSGVMYRLNKEYESPLRK